MRPEDVHNSEDFARYLREQRAENEAYYRTPRSERVLLAVVLVVLVLVVVSGFATALHTG